MVRPRWHDAVLAIAILGLLAAGVWALWWDEARAALHLLPDAPPAAAPGHAQT
jgi:anaerobic glycerol-3-phosphate dehydrogenase